MEQLSFVSSKQQGNGISAADIKKLIDAGFNTIESVAYTYMKMVNGL
jgi:hypothetical protein